MCKSGGEHINRWNMETPEAFHVNSYKTLLYLKNKAETIYLVNNSTKCVNLKFGFWGNCKQAVIRLPVDWQARRDTGRFEGQLAGALWPLEGQLRGTCRCGHRQCPSLPLGIIETSGTKRKMLSNIWRLSCQPSCCLREHKNFSYNHGNALNTDWNNYLYTLRSNTVSIPQFQRGP